MQHLNEIAALCRSALAGDREASNEAVERLLEVLMREDGDDIEAIDTILTLWDRSRMERLTKVRIVNPRTGEVTTMHPVPTEPLGMQGRYIPFTIPEPQVLLVRLQCPQCEEKFLWHASYKEHWMNNHLVMPSHQRI